MSLDHEKAERESGDLSHIFKGSEQGADETFCRYHQDTSKPPNEKTASPKVTMQDRIVCVREDEKDLKKFWNISFSKEAIKNLLAYYKSQADALKHESDFDSFDQEEKVDYVLLDKYLRREIRRLEQSDRISTDIFQLLPFLASVVSLLEARQKVWTDDLRPKDMADTLASATKAAQTTLTNVEQSRLPIPCDAMMAFRLVRTIKELQTHLSEFFSFFSGYNPLFDWWVTAPYQAFVAALEALTPAIESLLMGVRPDDSSTIFGDAIGRAGLLAELEAEVIPYSPEQLLSIARAQYAWCEAEMVKASRELGFGSDWRAALEHVKNIYLDPTEQPGLIKRLVDEGAAYVTQHDLVTIPPAAADAWRMFMMSPEAQRTNPFFLGGRSIIVSYPTADMAHADKLMSLRGNNAPMCRATAFHEMIPGHHLQMHYSARHRPDRRLFTTPFYVEGWAMYWELVLWRNGDFFETPADRVGTLFWRMHRCARILFSLHFHLGQMTPQECVELLVGMVGHERATAEGEVRRSLNGDYSPLYQAGYYLGALQLWALREEVLGRGLMGEKEFHDRVLRASEMPIEMLRSLLLGEELTRDHKARWKFYGEIV